MEQTSLFNKYQNKMVDTAPVATTEQEQQLARVGGKIGGLILKFRETKRTNENWHLVELHNFVCSHETVAPGSTDRILRMLRRNKQLNYEVQNRAKSLYCFID